MEMKQSIFSGVIQFFLIALILPNVCHADAINPVTNLFTRETVIPTLILTIIIILIEAFLLWWWIKPKVNFRYNLSRSTIINIISSAAGSIVVWLFYGNEPDWKLSFFISMFLLTLATETPAIKVLYKNNGVNWMKAIKISGGINLVSYAFIFIFQFLFVFTFFGYANFLDKQSIKNWNDSKLLDKESGYIYTVDSLKSDKYYRNILKRYDVASKSWSTIDPGGERGIEPTAWDIRGDTLACIIETDDYENKFISIMRGSAYTPITKIKGQFGSIRISPNLKKIAVLECVKEAVAPRDANSHFILGSACRLKVYDIETGVLLYEAPDFALDMGLCWTNDSNKLLFTSLRDKNLFNNYHDSTSTSYGRGYAKEGQFPVDIFTFDLATKSVRNVVEGIDPQIVSSTGDITFIREKEAYKNELWCFNSKAGKSSMVIGDFYSYYGYRHAVSPSGMHYLVQKPHKQPLGSSSFLTVIEPINDGRKFIIQPSSYYDFRWVP